MGLENRRNGINAKNVLKFKLYRKRKHPLQFHLFPVQTVEVSSVISIQLRFVHTESYRRRQR